MKAKLYVDKERDKLFSFDVASVFPDILIADVEDIPESFICSGASGTPALLTSDNELVEGEEEIFNFLQNNYHKIN